MNRIEFITYLLPHAVAALGCQHGWLVRWALAKAAQECGWNLQNELIVQANNCLGIKAAPGVPAVTFDANTGPEAGESTRWRWFISLEACFAEFARMLNDREPYQPFRNEAMLVFEHAYTGGLAGHALEVLENYHEATALMQESGITDSRGRLIKD